MSLIEQIVDYQNLTEALNKVCANRGAPGVDGMTTEELRGIFYELEPAISKQILEMKYRPNPVKRVYIPKPNGKKRPLGIPTAMDRVIQQAVLQVLGPIFDAGFSERSHGFRPNRSCHTAMFQVLGELNEGYEWIVDLDIEKFFDTVHQDKLISAIRTKVNEREVLHLIRQFLKAGIMEKGLFYPSDKGTPQGGPLSPLLSNIYLDMMDKELEKRGLAFCRYADDCIILVKSKMAANRVMKSVTNWLERKLFLKVSASKTKVVRPGNAQFLGFGFWKDRNLWKCKPQKDRKARLYDKIREVLCRKRAIAMPLSFTFNKVNQIVRGWINYYRIGSMKGFLGEFGEWLRHKIRVVILKQWKRPGTIFRNLSFLNKKFKSGFSLEDIRQTANSRLGWYRKCGMKTVNFILSPNVLAMRSQERPGLINPLIYYNQQVKLVQIENKI